MTKEQTIAIMAATIYAIRTSANPERHRLTTLMRDAVEEAKTLLSVVRDPDEER